ncbi:hypothetical protein ABZP36_004747 [Zizania latifolia]
MAPILLSAESPEDINKDKPEKPPRRHATLTKTITLISVLRSRRSDRHGKFDTPTLEVSMSIARCKFSTLSLVSYWMTQIRLTEAASKHSISLGYFKLALESKYELMDRMREEIKAYVVRHNLAMEWEEPVKDTLQDVRPAAKLCLAAHHLGAPPRCPPPAAQELRPATPGPALEMMADLLFRARRASTEEEKSSTNAFRASDHRPQHRRSTDPPSSTSQWK